MEIFYIDNACCIYEADGFSLLSDPWLTDGAFEGSWYHPTGLITEEKVQKALRADALYISHLHPDHFDEVTLAKFRKDIPLIILDEGANYLHRKLNALGFTNLIKLKDGESNQVGPFKVSIYAPFVSHPFDESVLGNFLDSAIVIEHGNYRVLNANDNTPTRETACRLREKHGTFDVAQLKLACAGPYPSCFLNLSHPEKLDEKNRLLRRQQEAMSEVAQLLGAEIQSFAGNYCLAGSQSWKNQYLAVDGLDLSKVPEGKSYAWENDDYPTPAELLPLLKEARDNLFRKQVEFRFHPNQNVTIKYGKTNFFSFNFQTPLVGDKAEPGLVCHLDTRLLKRILLRQSHWNNAEIGCHIDFYREPNIYRPDVHTMMSFFHT